MKLKLTYAPDGEPPQEWEFDPDNLGSMEAELLEEAGGVQWDTLAGWLYKIRNGGWRSIRVLLWLLLRRANPDLDLNEVQPKIADISFTIPDEDQEPGKDEAAAESTDSESPNAA